MKKSLTLIAVVVLLVVLSAVVFAACMPSDPAKAKEKYADKDYTIVEFNTAKAGNVATATILSLVVELKGGVTGTLSVTNGTYSGAIVWFEETDDAKAYAKYLNDNKSEDSNTYIKRDGKAVFAGDKEAYKFKKA